jgi:hypothetical protein
MSKSLIPEGTATKVVHVGLILEVEVEARSAILAGVPEHRVGETVAAAVRSLPQAVGQPHTPGEYVCTPTAVGLIEARFVHRLVPITGEAAA